jgi:hypothetical protein
MWEQSSLYDEEYLITLFVLPTITFFFLSTQGHTKHLYNSK